LGGYPETESGWKEEALGVIHDVEKHVKSISIADKIQSDAKKIYLNITTHEDKKLTVQLNYLGFHIVCDGKHDTVEDAIVEESVPHMSRMSTSKENDSLYFETPYALLSSVSAGYDKSFSDILINKLKNLQN
jgi:hypothetical protein